MTAKVLWESAAFRITESDMRLHAERRERDGMDQPSWQTTTLQTVFEPLCEALHAKSGDKPTPHVFWGAHGFRLVWLGPAAINFERCEKDAMGAVRWSRVWINFTGPEIEVFVRFVLEEMTQ